jgi:integrase
MPTLTVASVQKYTAQAKRREIPDAKATGLYLVIQPSGAKGWALRFRRPSGKPCKLVLGRVDPSDRETKDEPQIGAMLTLGQARVLAAQIDRRRAQGIDVIEEHKAARMRQQVAAQDRAANTFGNCVREFFATYKTKRKAPQRRWRENASLMGLQYKPSADPATAEPVVIKGGLADVWCDKPVAEIDGHDVHTVISESSKRGSDDRARKLHAALSILFSWLLRQRRVTVNACGGVWRPGPPPARERTLTDAEIAAFWRGCNTIGAPFGQMFQFMLIAACRLREAANMTRGEVDAAGVWTVPGSRTKNGRSFSLALPPLAIQTIGSVPVLKSAAANYVFTTNGRTPVSGFSVAKKQLDAAIAKGAGHAVAFRLHDLRRTAASGMAALGISLPVIEKVLNHVSGSFGGIVSVYQKHEYTAEKAEALARWARHISGLVSGESKVLTMKRGRK